LFSETIERQTDRQTGKARERERERKREREGGGGREGDVTGSTTGFMNPMHQ
jgi:hypothetical protein